MNKAGRIKSIFPQYALPGGQITVECEGFELDHHKGFGCYIGGERCRLVAASSTRLIAIVPEGVATENTQIHLESGGEQIRRCVLVHYRQQDRRRSAYRGESGG